MDTTGNDPWNFHKCKCCSYRTRFLSNIQNHVTRHQTRLDNYSCNQPLMLSPDKYQCEKCPNQFDLKILLTRHFNLFHKEIDSEYDRDPILKNCEHCDFHTYSLLVLLSHHCRSHETEEYRQCEEEKENSNWQMSQNTKLEKIRRNHRRIQRDHSLFKVTVKDYFSCHLHSPDKYQCKCDMQFDLKILLTKHFNMFHKGKETEHFVNPVLRNCDNCDFQTYSLLVLLSHRSGSHSSQSENDPQSEEEDSDQHRTELNDHRFNCQLGSPDKYLCKECQLQCDLKVLLKRHFNTYHEGRETKHYLDAVLRYCQACSFETFSSLVLLSHHIRYNGIGNHIFQAPQIADKKRELRQHTKKITRIQCDHCSYIATTKKQLRAHVHWKHTPSEQIRWFSCEECSHKTRKKSDLRKHVLAKHTEPAELEKLKRFKCDICSYRTVRKSHLRYHILNVHTPTEEINWSKCEQCPFKSKLKSSLRRHITSRHTQPSEQEELKRFKCNQCSYKAPISTRLKKHVLRRHTPLEEINWFKCERCPYKGKEKKALQQHSLRCSATRRSRKAQ